MIAFNLQPLATPNLTGIGYYAANVMKELIPDASDGYELHVFDFLGRNDPASMLREHIPEVFDETRLHTCRSVPLSAYIRMGRAGRIIPYGKLTRSSADITVFFNFLAPAGLTGRHIITIYDMVSRRYPETMQKRNMRLLRAHLQDSADRASLIITISEFSKREIHELLNIPEEKILVAHCGVDTSFYKPFESEKEEAAGRALINRRYGTDRFFLYVGTLEPRKNITTIVKAFDLMAGDHPDIKLILAGGKGWKSQETEEAVMTSPYRDRIIRTGYIDDETKRLLYRSAEAFVFPSLYEGFGMPVTEAMACGTVPVISDSSSLPEASRGMGLTASCKDTKAFAGLFDGIASGRTVLPKREELVSAASEFTWSNAAKVYDKAFHML